MGKSLSSYAGARKLPFPAFGCGAALGVLLCILSVPMVANTEWPPQPHPERIIAGFFYVGLFVMGSFGCRSSKRFSKLGYTAVMLVAALFVCVAISSQQSSTHLFPWIAVWAVAAVGVAGFFLARHAILAVALAAAYLWWSIVPTLPPRMQLPAIVEAGSLRLKLYKDPAFTGGSPSYSMEVSSLDGSNPGSKFDPNSIRIEALAGPFVPVRCWPARDVTDFREHPDPFHRQFLFDAFYEPSFRSLDVEVALAMKQGVQHFVFKGVATD